MDWVAIGTFITACGGIISAVVVGLKARSDANRAAKKDELDALRVIIDELKERIGEQQAENDLLRGRVDTLETENTELEKKVTQLEKERATLRRRMTELSQENEQLHEHVKKLHDKLGT